MNNAVVGQPWREGGLRLYYAGIVTWWISPRWQAIFAWDGPSG